jgi:hypothetical protein
MVLRDYATTVDLDTGALASGYYNITGVKRGTNAYLYVNSVQVDSEVGTAPATIANNSNTYSITGNVAKSSDSFKVFVNNSKVLDWAPSTMVDPTNLPDLSGNQIRVAPS